MPTHLIVSELDHGHAHGSDSASPTPGTKTLVDPAAEPDDLAPLLPTHSIAPPPHALANSPKSHRRSDSLTRAFNRRRSDSNNSISFHPAQVRASLVQVAEELREEAESPEPRKSPSRRQSANVRLSSSAPGPNEGGSLEEVLANARGISPFNERDDPSHRAEEGRSRVPELVESDEDDEEAPPESGVHKGHSHANGVGNGHTNGHSHGGHGHGHDHGSMNMKAVLLHVMGDALGNIGVIATGLIIWFTEWKFKFYCDPAISLVITIIIFSSALPLGEYVAHPSHHILLTTCSIVKSASFILLQGVPTSVSLEAVRSAILAIPGVISVHELHIWQLSESKIVASIHVLVRKSLKGCPTPPPETAKAAHALMTQNGPEMEISEHVYMSVAADIRRVLHEFGIHSSTIQPEYAMEGTEDAVSLKRFLRAFVS